MPAGRPTDYNEKILEKAREYLDSCVDEEYDWTKSDGEKSTSWEHRTKVKLPSIEGLAVYLKVNRSTIYEWKEIHEEFSNILEEILAEQANRLISKGLSGDYNPTISKLILTKHGYTDKTETDITSDGKPLPILASFNVSTHDGDEENLEAETEDTRDSGRDISQQDHLDSADSDSSRTER